MSLLAQLIITQGAERIGLSFYLYQLAHLLRDRQTTRVGGKKETCTQ